MVENARERFIRESHGGFDPVDTIGLNFRNKQRRWEDAGHAGAFRTPKTMGKDFMPVMDERGRTFELWNSQGQVDPFPRKLKSTTQPAWLEAGTKWKENIPLMLRSLRQRDEFKDWSDDELTHYMHRTFSNRGGLMSLV